MIKRLDQSSVASLVELIEKYFSDGWTESMLISAFKRDDFYAYGFFENQLLTGFITYTVGEDFADLEDVLIVPDYRKRGQAKQLLGFMLNDLSDKGVNKILLEVRKSNAPAINLYEAFGFKVISKRKKYYQDGEDAFVMIKEN